MLATGNPTDIAIFVTSNVVSDDWDEQLRGKRILEVGVETGGLARQVLGHRCSRLTYPVL